MSESSSSSSSLSPLSPHPTTSSHSRPRSSPRPPQQTSRKHHQPSRTGLEELLSKLEQNPELVGELLREVKAREETCSEFANQKKSRSKRLKKQWDARSVSDAESGEEDGRWKSESRARVSNFDAGRSSTYPPPQIHRQRPRKSSIDILQARPLRSTTERNEEISGEESEGSIEGEAAFLLSGVKGFDEDIEMGAGDPRGRTKVTTGAGPISSMKNLVQNAASFVRGRSPVRRPRISISSSPPLSRASSTSSHRSRSRSQSPAPAPLQYHDPVLGPFHPPKIKVDFKFPSSFNSTGLPNYPKNKFLPRRLREQVSKKQHLSAQQREVIEAGKHWKRRARRRNRNLRGGEGGEVEQGGPIFPCLLAAVLVVLPIALLSLVLGLVFRFSQVRI